MDETELKEQNTKQTLEKRTFREDFRLIRRAVGIWRKILPGYWTYQFINLLLNAFTPYFGLYMSAQIVNELTTTCDGRRLFIIAGITVGGEFLISILKMFFEKKRNLKNSMSYQRYEAFMMDAQNNTQYEHLENPDVILLRQKITAYMNANNSGLFAVRDRLTSILYNILSIIFSVSLTASLFSLTADKTYTGILGFINSPYSAVLIVVFILANTFTVIKLSNTRTTRLNNIYGDEYAIQGTRLNVFAKLKGSDMVVFGLNKIVLEEFKKHCLRPSWFMKAHRTNLRFNALSSVINQALNIAIYIFTAAKAFIGAIGIGNFVMYQGTISRFIWAVSGLTSNIGKIRHNNTYLTKLYTYLDLPNNMYKGTLAVEKRDDIDYTIEFRDVSFKYPRTDAYALRHVNMKFKIGDKLAIVGENGSGKTTFIKLLCRLYDPTEGKILLNGIDITRYRYDEYMSLFSVVFQDYTLFGFPLGENVAADVAYDEKKVRDCLVRAGMGEKLADLDNDPNAKEPDPLKRAIDREYDADAIDFSGGEQQKIAIARALYKDAPFVILDEPTAALDPIAEAAVYENFNKMVENKTSVFISHRLSSCRFCDSIAVFDHGQLVQQGKHDDLVNEKGKYADLWQAQAQYYGEAPAGNLGTTSAE